MSKPHFVVVHGVQLGSDKDIQSAEQIQKLIQNTMNNIPTTKEFETIGVKYEDDNDEAQQPYQWLLKALTLESPIIGSALTKITDIVADVITASKGSKLAGKIREKIKDQIILSHNNGHSVYLVAHSLGTVYCLDAIRELMEEGDYFKGDDVTTWPVRGFITLGSPLGLTEIFKPRSLPLLDESKYKKFIWHNFYHPLDPVVSGNIFGAPLSGECAKSPVEYIYQELAEASKWHLQGHRTVANKQWLFAHMSYWDEPVVGDILYDMVWR
jgi:hypothetical protein